MHTSVFIQCLPAQSLCCLSRAPEAWIRTRVRASGRCTSFRGTVEGCSASVGRGRCQSGLQFATLMAAHPTRTMTSACALTATLLYVSFRRRRAGSPLPYACFQPSLIVPLFCVLMILPEMLYRRDLVSLHSLTQLISTMNLARSRVHPLLSMSSGLFEIVHSRLAEMNELLRTT